MPDRITCRFNEPLYRTGMRAGDFILIRASSNMTIPDSDYKLLVVTSIESPNTTIPYTQQISTVVAGMDDISYMLKRIPPEKSEEIMRILMSMDEESK